MAVLANTMTNRITVEDRDARLAPISRARSAAGIRREAGGGFGLRQAATSLAITPFAALTIRAATTSGFET
jgi:hypothetical protein